MLPCPQHVNLTAGAGASNTLRVPQAHVPERRLVRLLRIRLCSWQPHNAHLPSLHDQSWSGETPCGRRPQFLRFMPATPQEAAPLIMSPPLPKAVKLRSEHLASCEGHVKTSVRSFPMPWPVFGPTSVTEVVTRALKAVPALRCHCRKPSSCV